jgi:hypothetical protein
MNGRGGDGQAPSSLGVLEGIIRDRDGKFFSTDFGEKRRISQDGIGVRAIKRRFFNGVVKSIVEPNGPGSAGPFYFEVSVVIRLHRRRAVEGD